MRGSAGLLEPDSCSGFVCFFLKINSKFLFQNSLKFSQYFCPTIIHHLIFIALNRNDSLAAYFCAPS